MVKSVSKKRTGLLGGSFDPVHIGHLILGQCAIEQCGLDKILFVPLFIPVHKAQPAASAQHRLNMLRLAVMDNPCFEVSTLEMERNAPSYSYDTLLTLKEAGKSARYSIILGSDAYSEIKSWKNYGRLKRMTDFIVAARPGAKIDIIAGLKIEKITVPELAVSSSSIRKSISNSQTVRYIIPDTVRDYIYSHGIYR